MQFVSAITALYFPPIYLLSLLSFVFFFIRQLPSELTEWNSTKIGHDTIRYDTTILTCAQKQTNSQLSLRYVLGSECDLKISEIIKNIYFRQLRNLMARLAAYIFGMKHDVHNRAQVLETTMGLLHRLKITNFGLQTA